MDFEREIISGHDPPQTVLNHWLRENRLEIKRQLRELDPEFAARADNGLVSSFVGPGIRGRLPRKR
jgi:hypothetical protein